MRRLLAKLCSPFVNDECCRALLIDFNFGNRLCVSLFISKSVGFGLIGFSAILKLPQLIQIIARRSGRGLSVPSLFMEIMANVLAIAYHRQNGFPFSTFGETILILIQNLLIAFFVTHFAADYDLIGWNAFVVVNSSLLFAVERGIVSSRVMGFMWTVCLPLSIAYKVPQILHTYRARCKGELSPLSCLLTLVGSCGRVFTTIRELHDMSVLAMYLLNVLLNGTILVQSVVYPKDKPKLQD
jgi:mannose-P-dolichol utilization defect protein 1